MKSGKSDGAIAREVFTCSLVPVGGFLEVKHLTKWKALSSFFRFPSLQLKRLSSRTFLQKKKNISVRISLTIIQSHVSNSCNFG
ncbi:hypothetical protein H6P81_020121 [Aristolochia fimbriata]|uniref:Uncharacterized protein n=1 Tax=Aristolochia fimbriata TaxID=158543 RepID=A0AAV7DUR6_ARIFI|nr:hypothetical protein H6P81_020121 [Aristolochia fimbriata]